MGFCIVTSIFNSPLFYYKKKRKHTHILKTEDISHQMMVLINGSPEWRAGTNLKKKKSQDETDALKNFGEGNR